VVALGRAFEEVRLTTDTQRRDDESRVQLRDDTAEVVGFRVAGIGLSFQALLPRRQSLDAYCSGAGALRDQRGLSVYLVRSTYSRSCRLGDATDCIYGARSGGPAPRRACHTASTLTSSGPGT
jgi:hypothetical protein